MLLDLAEEEGLVEIRFRGLVQGVGFRPTVWRIATEQGLRGEVLNDAEGVLVRLAATKRQVEDFLRRLIAEAPPLSRIDAIEKREALDGVPHGPFRIAASVGGAMNTLVTPDAATCAACLMEIGDPGERRHGYAFANCTHCGPRTTIALRVPYDRANTTMAAFDLCPACRREYEDPGDRRFHAQPIACAVCGPALSWRLNGEPGDATSAAEPLKVTVRLIREGGIVAIKGLGGYHLACDATDAAAVARLRERKRRPAKAFALMARDVESVRRYCRVSEVEAELLESKEAPIVLLQAEGPDTLPDEIAPGLAALGFMLPYTPLHYLLLSQLDGPIVLTSGNRSDEPQCVDAEDAEVRLAGVADGWLHHDRAIASRMDDSVVRVIGGAPVPLRRARGYAPATIALPPGFEDAPDLLALGGEMKNTFCLLRGGQAIVSQHQGDLEHDLAFDDFRKNLDLYRELFDHRPAALVVDPHPEYLSTKHGRAWGEADGLPVIEVRHHHAHMASCMADNGVPLDCAPVLGVVLDGLGWGEDGTFWGGEFLLGDYHAVRRVAALKPVAMPGGVQAVREPWRNAFAHIHAALGWEVFLRDFGDTGLARRLKDKPVATMAAMIDKRLNAPSASSCGRLFDAVAAALGVCLDRTSYEGEPAARLESLLGAHVLADTAEETAYPFAVTSASQSHPAYLEPRPMWLALLGDLRCGAPREAMAARFHAGLSRAIADMAATIAPESRSVALSGGCLQNRPLAEDLVRRLEGRGFRVLRHARVPPNDGGLSMGQAAVAAARLLRKG